MARKKKSTDSERIPGTQPSAPVITQLITETIEENYMPYVMSVIVSRAIPAIDGFKPAHRPRKCSTSSSFHRLKGRIRQTVQLNYGALRSSLYRGKA